MEEQKTFIVQDENGLQSVATILSIIEVEGKEYVIYSIDKDVENSDVFTARVVKDANGEDHIQSIEDPEEKAKVFKIVEDMINES